MSQAEQIKKLQKQIAEGLQPVCPICGSGLKIEKQEGATGAHGYNYHCTKENDPECILLPATVYTSWSRRIEHALKSKVVAVAIAVIGSISLTLGAGTSLGWIKFGQESEKNQEQSGNGGQGATQITNDSLVLDSMQRENDRLLSELNTAKDSLQSFSNVAELITFGKIWKADAFPDNINRKDLLLGALNDIDKNPDIDITAFRLNKIIEDLAGIIVNTPGIFDTETLDHIVGFTNKFALPTQRERNLGIFYFHLATNKETDPDKRRESRKKSLENYREYLNDLKSDELVYLREKCRLWQTTKGLLTSLSQATLPNLNSIRQELKCDSLTQAKLEELKVRK